MNLRSALGCAALAFQRLCVISIDNEIESIGISRYIPRHIGAERGLVSSRKTFKTDEYMSVSILPHVVRARQAAPSSRKSFHLRRHASQQWMYLTYKGMELDDAICYRPVECGNVVGQECQTFLSADFGDRNRDRRQALPHSAKIHFLPPIAPRIR